MADVNTAIQEFERGRVQLSNLSIQKQQLQMQSDALFQTIEELKKSKEEKVFKFAGSIMIQAPVAEVQKEVEAKKESVDLRFKTVSKQETILLDKLNRLKSEIEKAQGVVKKPSESPTSDVS